MTRRHRPAFRTTIFQALAFLTVIATASSSAAETVEVAPGVQVTKRTYSDAPVNEQPFYGFAAKTDAMRVADDQFVNAVLGMVGSREKAASEASKRGWRALSLGQIAEASRRFNQAYLFAPDQSFVYHGFAAITAIRFKDLEYADELFQVALKQPNPLKTLKADYGRFLLTAKRPAQALPLLEQAVKDTPDFGDAWSNLAWARLETGDRDGACTAAEEATKRRPSSTQALTSGICGQTLAANRQQTLR
jgi:predicted Zn-dependent protease